MAQNSASGLVKNKLYSKQPRLSKNTPLMTTLSAPGQKDQLESEEVQNRIVVKHATTIGLEKGVFDLAVDRKRSQSNRWYKGEQVPITVDREHFKIYGPGIYLFFEFLWRLSLVFLILALISTVPIVYNWVKGDRFSNAVSSLDVYVSKMSISNFYGNNPMQSSTQQISNTQIPKLINCVADLLSCLVLMVFYFYWTDKSEKITEEIKKSFKMPNYFTLEVEDFPENTSEHEIYTFFNKFGMVTEVAPVKNYSETIQLSKQIYELETELKELQMQEQEEPSQKKKQQIDKLQKKVSKLYKDLRKEEMKTKDETIKYYVSFSTPLERANTLKRFNKVYNQFCLPCRKLPEDYLLKGSQVLVTACHDQPGQIIWENVHITWKTRWMRALAQFIILLACILVGFFVISSLNIITPPSALQSIDTSSYSKSSILLVTNQTIVESWCLKNTDNATSTPELSNTCQKYITRYYVNLAITYGITVLVILIKTILKKLVIFIAKFQRYKEHTEQSIDIMKNLVIIYVITTVVIGFLLQANLFGIRFKMIIPELLNSSTMKQNAQLLTDYAVLENNWYVDIGYQIWLTWLIMAVSPHSYMPFYYYLMEWLNEWWARNEKVQKNMDKAMEPAEFQIEDHYANIIMIFLVGFAFSGGMPCILPVAFVGIITRYLYLKFLFIRFSKIPKSIDEHLNQTVLSYFPWTLAIHFLLSIWMYSVPTIFAFQQSVFSEWVTFYFIQYKSSSSTFVQFISKILGMGIASYYYTLAAAVMMLMVLVKNIIYDFLLAIFRKEQDNLQEIQKQDSQNDIVANMRSQRNLTTSYKIQNNPNYFEILSIKHKMKAKIQNGDFDQDNENDSDQKN